MADGDRGRLRKRRGNRESQEKISKGPNDPFSQINLTIRIFNWLKNSDTFFVYMELFPKICVKYLENEKFQGEGIQIYT